MNQTLINHKKQATKNAKNLALLFFSFIGAVFAHIAVSDITGLNYVYSFVLSWLLLISLFKYADWVTGD